MRSATGWKYLQCLALCAACAREPTPDQLSWFGNAAAGIDASATHCVQELREVTRSYPESACRALDVDMSPRNRWMAREIAENEIARQLATLQSAEQPLRDVQDAKRTTATRVSAGIAQAHWVAERLCRARDVAITLARRESRRAPDEIAKQGR